MDAYDSWVEQTHAILNDKAATVTQVTNSNNELALWLFSLEIGLIGVISLSLATYLIVKGHEVWGVLRGIGTLTIIIVAALLIIGGYGPEQIAAAIGLLGTIAGYLLAKRDSSE